MNNDGLLMLLWLLAGLGAGNPKAHALIKSFGSLSAVYNASSKELEKHQRLTSEELARLERGRSLVEARQVIGFCLQNGVKILTVFDKVYPQKLLNITPCPLALFYRGTLFDFDDELCITIVGTRNMSQEGAKAARQMARDLAASGAVIVSGLARGIDSMAHIGALEAGGRTAAVIGNGIDVVYPPENRRLYSEIAERGLIMTEYLPGTPPYPHHFRVRNRLLSALSNGVLVAESGSRGGSLITVNWALEHGKDIFAMPGDVSRPQSEGTNALIKQGAKLVTRPSDVLEEYIYTHGHKIKPGTVKNAPPPRRRATVRRRDFAAEVASEPASYRTKTSEPAPSGDTGIVLSENEQKLLLACGPEPLDAGALAARSGVALAEALLALTKLELAGLVIQLPGGGYKSASL